jgi:3',5'-cyclic AMP phosphodiesterase CpdA
VDTAVLLGQALDVVESAALNPTAVVFTGDLVEDGAPEQYHRLRDLIAPTVARLATTALFVAGNHDDRADLRRHLLDQPATTEALDHMTVLDGLRIVVLDSTVPGAGYGHLDPG